MLPTGSKRKTPDSSPRTPIAKRRQLSSHQNTLPVPPSPLPNTPERNHTAHRTTPDHDAGRSAEHPDIVQREFYPSLISNERCAKYSNNEIPRPIEVFEDVVASTASARNAILTGNAVVHWFKRDLRLNDNRPLSLASAKAKEAGIPLICMFIVSPQDYQAHLTAPVRVDFELRTLAVLKDGLAALDIPLWVETVEKRKTIPDHIIELCQRWGAKHVFCGIEYEVDELRRDALLTRKCLDQAISFTALHDDAVVPPGALPTGSVFSPWYKAWVSYLQRNPTHLSSFESPTQNPASVRTLLASIFTTPIPSAHPNKSLTDSERTRFHNLWPAGEAAAHDRLDRFLAEKITAYKSTKNILAAGSTAILSAHLASGTLSARTAVRRARDLDGHGRLDRENSVFGGWIAEVAWRDFYKHVLAHWPFVCMNRPFRYTATDIEWDDDPGDKLWKAWCTGQTGFPIVDAGMRQLNFMGYMHNRARMITASFLTKDLLLDWRRGERYFMEHLVDGDFASNNGGWGFSASVGVDPQPWVRVFNPLLQSEKFDEDGEYIRKWVPELREVKGKAVHDPYGRGEGKVAARNGYPKPVVDHKVSRVKALERMKHGVDGGTP